jgi:hypothetical protein
MLEIGCDTRKKALVGANVFVNVAMVKVINKKKRGPWWVFPFERKIILPYFYWPTILEIRGEILDLAIKKKMLLERDFYIITTLK